MITTLRIAFLSCITLDTDLLTMIVSRPGPGELFGRFNVHLAMLIDILSSQDPKSPTVDWSHVHGLFERAKSDVLVLLDCCAAASSAPRGGDSHMETIAACGFESRAPPPGEHSFTTTLTEVLQDWVNTPSFSVTMLHSEVLRVLMRRRKERCINGQKLEWRSTPIHMNNFTNSRTLGIELCKRSLIDAGTCPAIQSQMQPVDEARHGPELTSSTYLDLMSLSTDALEDTLNINHEVIASNSSSNSNLGSDADSVTCQSSGSSPVLALPHMLIAITLDEDQPLPNIEACRNWICSFPGLAKCVKVEGVFTSYSTVLILSIPVVIWNMLPENPACQPVSYVTSRNLILDTADEAQSRPKEIFKKHSSQNLFNVGEVVPSKQDNRKTEFLSSHDPSSSQTSLQRSGIVEELITMELLWPAKHVHEATSFIEITSFSVSRNSITTRTLLDVLFILIYHTIRARASQTSYLKEDLI
jgi:hypothetical protein